VAAAPPPAKPTAAPSPTKPAATEPHPKTPADDKPIDLVKRPESHPAPVVAAAHATAAPAKPKSSTAALASIDAARCKTAAADVEKDAWAIPALGDHALCLIDQGKTKEAGNRLDQLAAFAPEDWRVALGRAALSAEKGDVSNAEISYRTAASLAPTETIRAAITARLSAHGDTP
jgi:Flp pilus assembly protein TadD